MSALFSGVVEKPFLYLAAPLFSAAEKQFNEEIAALLARYFTVYLPQRDGGLYMEMIRRGISAADARRQIFSMDLKALDQADTVFAVLDGRTIDEGVALELGYAYALRKPCYGIQTDPRRLLPVGNNPMVDGVLTKVLFTTGDLLIAAESIAQELAARALERGASA